MAKRYKYTQRTLAEIKKLGYEVGIVERFIAQAGRFGKKIDLFGFGDLIYLDTKAKQIVIVQSTGQHGHAAHRHTILHKCRRAAKRWLKCQGRIELWSWRLLLVKRGGKLRRWTPRIEEITLDSLLQARKEG